jgi:preprotein translocase subunit SecY
VFSKVSRIFKVPDLRKKIFFTLIMIVVYRIGAHIPVPGVDYTQIQAIKNASDQGGALALLNLFSGNSLGSFAVFSLGVMPYITASIIVQILGVVIPKLEEWQNQGAVGQRKITQWTRYLAVVIALVQGTGITYLFANGGGSTFYRQVPTGKILVNANLGHVMLVVITLVAGVALLMWMGEVVTQRGIGNGMSILIFSSVVSGLPGNYANIFRQTGWGWLIVLLAFSVATLVAIVFVEQGVRKIPVQFAKRVVGRRMYGGQNTYIPLKVNQAGVVPIIFASSILYLPLLIANVSQNTSVNNFVDKWITTPTNPVHMILYFLLILGFAYFYVAIAFDPIKQADQIRKQGGFIPGIRPGRDTESYLGKVLNRITFPGALFIAALAIIPSIISSVAGVTNYAFGGTTVLIAVGVALETVKQLDAQLMQNNYEGFLK